MSANSVPAGDVTMLLRQLAGGQHNAGDRLAEMLYQQLRNMAARQLRGLRGATLHATSLVHEAWLKLCGGDRSFHDRQHFMGVAARAMRSVLVDHVRRKRAQKRGGLSVHSSLDDVVARFEGGAFDVLDLDAAMDELERDDPQLARWVGMRFFSGMSHAEIAAAEGVSESTVERGWRCARALLRSRLTPRSA